MDGKKKTVESNEDLRVKVPDVVLVGDVEWELVNKASSEHGRWMKSTKRLQVEGGYLYQTTSEYYDAQGFVCAGSDALQYVPHSQKLDEYLEILKSI